MGNNIKNSRQKKLKEYLSNPEKILYKEDFTRGIDMSFDSCATLTSLGYNEKRKVELPDLKRKAVSQSLFLRELDPNCHNVLFDENIPSICREIADGQFQEIKYQKMACALQRNIRDKHVLHLCGNPMQFTLMETEPSIIQQNNFTKFKQYWSLRNQDGMRCKMVSTQKGVGDAALLYYFNYKGEIKSRLLSYPDYVILPLNDENGDRLLESVYYSDGNLERIDSYDDYNMYRFVLDNNNLGKNKTGWRMEGQYKHGFIENPLITKRGEVAWNKVQSNIETYEIIYNIYNVIQKRQGWGILFLRGNISNTIEKFNGSLILKATGLDAEKATAEYKVPPTGEGMKESMELIKETIQTGAGCTFLLPKDIKMAGDISGVAIMLTQSLDIETALQGTIEWQNVANKMTRLFKYGLSKELVNNGINNKAITEFNDLSIQAQFKVWKPQSDTDYATMLVALKSAGLISEETGIEKNPVSSPDEKNRRKKEEVEKQTTEAENALKQTTNLNNIKEG